ncbi:hypothetical protein JCM1840_002833 [Sporobolomyces johnsonii]
MSSSIAASLGLTRPRKRTSPFLESGEFTAPPPTSFASPQIHARGGEGRASIGTLGGVGAGGRKREADEESLFELETYFVDEIRAVGTPKVGSRGGGDGDESEDEYPTIRFVAGETAPKGLREVDIAGTPLTLPEGLANLGNLENLGSDVSVVVRETILVRNSSVATIDKPYMGRSISYHRAPLQLPASLIPASTAATAAPLPAPVPPSASSLGVQIPLTLPLNVPHRVVSQPPPLPPKSPIQPPVPAQHQHQTFAPSPLATPTSAHPPLSTPGREHPPSPASVAFPSPLPTPGREQPPSPAPLPSPLPTPGREQPPSPAPVALSSAVQVERSMTTSSMQTSSSSSSITIRPSGPSLNAGVMPGRKPVPALFALSNAATAPVSEEHRAVLSAGPSSVPLSRYGTHGASASPPQPAPAPAGLPSGPSSVPLSRYGTHGASASPPVQPVAFSPPTIAIPPTPPDLATAPTPPPSQPSPVSSALYPSHSTASSSSISSKPSSSSLAPTRSSSSLAFLHPLTKFPDPSFSRRPLVLSEHMPHLRSPSSNSLWDETAGDGELTAKEGRKRRRRKMLGRLFRTGKGGVVKWVGSDGPGQDDEGWTKAKWALVVSLTSLFGYGLAGLICAFSTLLHSWNGADVALVAEPALLTWLTLASFVILLTSLLGLSGTLLNSRPLLAIYAVLLWPCLALLLVVGYSSYRRAHLSLPNKVDEMWSRSLGPAARKVAQDAFNCCGYYNSFHDATFTPTCYPRSNLPGCKGALLDFDRTFLTRVYRCSLGIVPLHIANIVAGLLCANHIDPQFGKGLMPRQYRLKATDLSPLLLPTLSRTFPSFPSPGAPAMHRHSLHRSSSSLSSQLEVDELTRKLGLSPGVGLGGGGMVEGEAGEGRRDREEWESVEGIRIVG